MCWAEEVVEHDRKYAKEGDSIPDITFDHFIKFLKTQYRIISYRESMAADGDSSSEIYWDDYYDKVYGVDEEEFEEEEEEEEEKEVEEEVEDEDDICNFDAQRCKFCACCAKFQPIDHSLEKCANFLRKDVLEREEICKALGICHWCLDIGHKASRCTQCNKLCEYCQGKHHSLLHHHE